MIDSSNVDEIFHIGTPRHSGRYPWGSGENPHQRSRDFLGMVDDLRKKGLSNKEIAEALGMDSGATLIRAKSIARAEKRAADEAQARYLREEKQMSNVAIGDRMGIPESSVRNLLNPSKQDRNEVLFSTVDMLKNQLEEKGMLDVGSGNEHYLGISDTKLKTALAKLEDEGYVTHEIYIDQLGMPGKKTTVKVLAPPGTELKDVYDNQDKIGIIAEYSEDGGRTYLNIEPPKAVDPNRVGVRYGDEGGADMDGVIQLRRGVEDLSLGAARYAQVRIQVGDGHFLKGMAMYSDNLPDGVDLMFNTNKNKKDIGNNPLDAMKGLKDDADNPFGSVVRQKHYVDANGKRQLSPLNIVGNEDPDGVKLPGEEGGWSQWSRTLSSQMLSKQTRALAKEQLDLTYQQKKAEYDEIMALTNPTIKKKLLGSFSDGVDSAAVQLKAAGLPGTANHVILPINSLKDNEIFAPNYNNGDRVVLIRHPHAGRFEIPELVVNNKNREANSLIRNARDAVGINSKVAARLSGADFDGDTVLVIPNMHQKVKSAPALKELEGFDPQSAYPPYDGMKTMDGGRWNAKTRKTEYAIDPRTGEPKRPSDRIKGIQMGEVSNLITDMTIKGATHAELARAVKHSMVVIDAEKHRLNWTQSAKDNNIKELKTKYQNSARGGASTIISRASSKETIPDRRLRRASEGGPIDPKTGRLQYTYNTETYVNKKGKTVPKKTFESTKMYETEDAFDLTSSRANPQAMETVYATHANKLKALANDARKSSLSVGKLKYNPSARTTYRKEVDSLNAKLNTAHKNRPLERKAQLIGNATVKQKTQANPNMDTADLKKVNSQALEAARRRTGAAKQRIKITPNEWEAIQSGAISDNMLKKILDNADLDVIKQYATPRTKTGVPAAKLSRARIMLSNGYTQAEVAKQLGISTSTLSNAING